MLSYFKNCQLKNPGFFYAFQMDVEGEVANCFWVDSRFRMAYKYFGRIIVNFKDYKIHDAVEVTSHWLLDFTLDYRIFYYCFFSLF